MKFRQTLFWDTDPKRIDPKKHAQYIIERILDLGYDKEVRWLWNYYDRRFIRKIVEKSRCLRPETKTLWELVLKSKQEYLHYGAIKILKPGDIAVMKIIAISQRGRKRDFFDLFWCAKNILPLEEIIKKLPAQYPSVAHNYQHILKSLVYFADGESDPDPVIYFKANWKEVKNYFTREIPAITRKLLKLE